jgi:hypothetical protein
LPSHGEMLCVSCFDAELDWCNLMPHDATVNSMCLHM